MATVSLAAVRAFLSDLEALSEKHKAVVGIGYHLAQLSGLRGHLLATIKNAENVTQTVEADAPKVEQALEVADRIVSGPAPTPTPTATKAAPPSGS